MRARLHPGKLRARGLERDPSTRAPLHVPGRHPGQTRPLAHVLPNRQMPDPGTIIPDEVGLGERSGMTPEHSPR
jgi:hypothetical protein